MAARATGQFFQKRIRAFVPKCCQYALLCGDIDGFEDNFVRLPRAARPARWAPRSLFTLSVGALLDDDDSWESLPYAFANRLHALEKPLRESLARFSVITSGDRREQANSKVALRCGSSACMLYRSGF